MAFIVVNGVRLHVQSLGPPAAVDGPESSSKPTVVFLHGLLFGSVASFYFTTAAAVARSRRAVLFDARGHGLSERASSGYDVESFAADLAGVVDAASPTAPVDLVGHSYGGLVALRYALARPERVRRLVIIEAPLPPSRAGDVIAFAREVREGNAALVPEPLRADVARGNRRGVRFLAQVRGLAFDTSLLADVRAEGDLEDEELARVATPITLLYGRTSSCLPSGERLARRLPDARLLVLEGGHYLHLDAPGEVTRQVLFALTQGDEARDEPVPTADASRPSDGFGGVAVADPTARTARPDGARSEAVDEPRVEANSGRDDDGARRG